MRLSHYSESGLKFLNKFIMVRFKIGDRVGWSSEAGAVTGIITAVHTKPFKVNGYTRHASKDNPQYSIKSLISEHIANHFAKALHKLQNGGGTNLGMKDWTLTPQQLSQLNRSGADNTTVNGITKFSPIVQQQNTIANAVTTAAQKQADANTIARRKAAIAKSNATGRFEDSAAGDKLRLFPDDAHSFIDDYLNPFHMVGNLADNLGHSKTPLEAAINTAIPLGVGALAGLGTNNTGEFVNNIVNPLAGLNPKISYKTPIKYSNSDGLLGNLSNALEKSDSRIRMSPDQLETLKNKYRNDFEKIVGYQYNEKDLGLYSKLQEAHNLDLADMNSVDTYANRSKEFINTHNLRENYTPEEEILMDAYTRGYDDMLNNREMASYKPVQDNFYNAQLRPKLEDLITSQKAKEPITLSRGDRDYQMENVWRDGVKLPSKSIKFSELQAGDEWEPNSFLSTTIRDNTSFGNIKSSINVPQGQSILFPNASGVKNFENEMEVILPHKLRYKVESGMDNPPPTFDAMKEGETYGDLLKKGNNLIYTSPDGIETPMMSNHVSNDYLLNKESVDINKFVHSIVNPYTPIPLVGAALLMNNKQNGGQTKVKIKGLTEIKELINSLGTFKIGGQNV